MHATFPAGLALADHKRGVADAGIVDLPVPAQLVVALDQGSGYAAEPVVAAGDRVAFGTRLARASQPLASALHAPFAGQVVAIEVRAAAIEGGRGPCVVIEPDGTSEVDPAVQPVTDFAALDPDDLVERLRVAGIAGLGGAAFPTATKLAAARACGVRRLVLNGAECEPWICCDDALMRAHAEDVVLGARILQHAIGAESCVIAVEDDKPAAVAALRAAAGTRASDAPTVEVVPAVYPQGAERQLITALTGIEVPSRGWPVDAGVACQNVATAAAVAQWSRRGEPAVSRIVTVTGSGVARPCNVRAAIGTPVSALVAAAGGYRGAPVRLIAGGNMTGLALTSDAAGITKATNCIFIATDADLGPRLSAREQPCIRCGDCATVCPAGLLPQQLHRAALAADYESLRRLGAHDCIDCGLCDYVCPSQIPLASRFRQARQALAATELAEHKADAARQRFARHEQRLREAAKREQLAFEAVRDRARHAGTDASGGAD